jgi:hypothetical protein
MTLRAIAAKFVTNRLHAVARKNSMECVLFLAARGAPTLLARPIRALDSAPFLPRLSQKVRKESLDPVVKEWLDQVIVPALVNRFLTKRGVMGTDSLVTGEKPVAKLPQLGKP